MGIFSKNNKDDAPKADAKVDAKTAKSTVKDTKPKAAKKTTAKSTVKSATSGNKLDGKAYSVLLKPVISEKATVGAALNKYVFAVAAKANKVEIKKAISETYGVVPVSINIINQRGNSVRFGRHWGTTKSVKKAVVTLKKGDSIKLYEGI